MTGKWKLCEEYGYTWISEGYRSARKGKGYEEGKWGYVPQMHSIQLIEGFGNVEEGTKFRGKRKYYPQMDEMGLDYGRQEISKWGAIREGRFAYIPELHGIRLIDGSLTFTKARLAQMESAYSSRMEGKWEWVPETKDVEVVA